MLGYGLDLQLARALFCRFDVSVTPWICIAKLSGNYWHC